MSYKLRDYQAVAINNLLRDKVKYWHFTVSGGKTLASLHAIDILRDFGEVKKVLVATTLNISKTVWEQESRDYGFDFTFERLYDYTILKCVDKRHSDKEIHLINVDKIQKFLDGSYAKEKINGKKVKVNKGVMDYQDFAGYDFLILDESTMFKRNSLRYKSLLKFVKKYNPKYRLCLSGSPRTNNDEDLFYQYQLLFAGSDTKCPIGSTLKEFRERYFFKTISYRGKKPYPEFEIKEGAYKQLAMLLFPHTELVEMDDVRKSVSEEQAEGVKEPIVENKLLELPPHLKKQYNIVKKSEVLKINSELDINISNDEELVFQIGNRNSMLRQFLSGFVYYSLEDMIANGIDNGVTSLKETKQAHRIDSIGEIKRACLRQVFKENPDDNILVLFNFEEEKKLLLEHFPEGVILNSKSAPTVKPRWDRGEIKYLFANPASIGHGMNLQFGGSIWVWYSPTYALEHWLQANGRLPRPGQKKRTKMITFRLKDTIEETEVYASLQHNRTQLDDWTKAIKFEKERLRSE